MLYAIRGRRVNAADAFNHQMDGFANYGQAMLDVACPSWRIY